MLPNAFIAPHRPKGGRPRLQDRACLTGISCSAVGFLGGCCRRNWTAKAWPAGGGCV